MGRKKMDDDPNREKKYKKLYKPAPKGKEFDDDYDIVKMMEQWDEDNREKIDWTGAAMVVQGASHLIARKVDVLHTEARQAADDLKNAEFDDDVDQDGNNNDGSGRKRKKTRLERLMEAKDIDEFNEGETFIDEDEEKRLFEEKVKKDKESGRGQKNYSANSTLFSRFG